MITRLRHCAFTVGLFALPLLSGPALAHAAAPTTDELLAKLEKVAPATPGTRPIVPALREALQQHRYSEVEQYLMAFDARPAGVRPNAELSQLVEALRTAIHAQAAAQVAERERTVDDVLKAAAERFHQHAAAADYDPLIHRLADLQAVPMTYNDVSAQRVQTAQQFVTRCQDYAAAVAAGSQEAAASALSNLIEFSARLSALPRSELLALQAGNQKQGDAGEARFETMRAKLAAAIESAKKPADLDPLLQDFAQANSNGRYSPALQKIERVRRFARRWQDYLGFGANGDLAGAQGVLKELTNDAENDAVYPRSKLLDRMYGPTADDKTTIIGPGALTLENLDQFVQQLGALPRQSSLTNTTIAMQGIASRAERLRAAAAQLKAGNPQPALSLATPAGTFYPTGDYAMVFDQMEQALICRALGASINPPAELQPKNNEMVKAYLDRVVVYGRDHKDWALVHRAINAEQAYAPVEVRNNGDVQSYTAFFTAMNLEQAGERVQAIRYYQLSARSPSATTPAQEIASRLQALKSGFPKDYELAQTQPPLDSSVVEPRYPASYGPMSGMPGRVRP